MQATVGKEFTYIIKRPRTDGTQAQWTLRCKVTVAHEKLKRFEYEVTEVLSEENVVSKGEMPIGSKGGLSEAGEELYVRIGNLVWDK